MAISQEALEGLMGRPNLQFSEVSREIIKGSEEEAKQFGNNFIDANHLLASWAKHPITVRALSQHSNISSTAEWFMYRGATMPPENAGFMPEVRNIIYFSGEAAIGANSNYIGAAELLYGLVRDRNSFSAGMLEGIGITLTSVISGQLLTRMRTIEVSEFNQNGEYPSNLLPNPSNEKTKAQFLEDLRKLNAVRNQEGDQAWARELGKIFGGYASESKRLAEMTRMLGEAEFFPLATIIDSTEGVHPLRAAVVEGLSDAGLSQFAYLGLPID